MRRTLAAVLVILSTVAVITGARAASPTTRWQGSWLGPLTEPAGSDSTGSWPARNYYAYVPRPGVLQPNPTRSLVIYLHGTTQTATNAALAAKWNDLADKKGFVVAYPEESTGSGSDTDGSNAARAWAWGQALIDDRNNGEVRTIAEITRRVMADYRIDPKHVYIAGLSAGAIMATVMAASYPDLYHGVASWAGCSYLCADSTGDLGYQRMGGHAQAVPAILFAGSTDYLINPAMSATAVNGWVGMDNFASAGGVSRTPSEGPTTYGADPGSLTPHPNTGPADGSRGDLGTCVYATHPKGNNPCPAADLGWSSYPYTVTKFGFTSSNCNGVTPLPESCVAVESWFIHGVSHNYAGGSNEGTFADPLGPDTTSAAWVFLSSHD